MNLNPVEGFVLGFTASWGCLLHCLPVAGPALLSGGGGIRGGIRFMAEFMAGRLISYAAAGMLVAAVGSRMSAESGLAAANLLYIPLGVLLVLHALRESGSGHALCAWLDRNRRWIRTPLALGLVLGFAPCPPFLLAAAAVLGSSGDSGIGAVSASAAFFLFFFAGSSIVLVPWAFAGPAAVFPPIRKAASATAVLAGLYFAFAGLEKTVNPPDTDSGPVIERYAGRLKDLVPEADSFSGLMETGGVPYVEARRLARKKVAGTFGREEEVGETKTAAVCVCTLDLSESRGFGGRIPALLAVKPDGSVSMLEVMEDNQETPSYVIDMYSSRFRDSYIGRRASDPMAPGGDVDALTGATVTQKALTGGIRDSLALVSSRVLGIEAPVRGGPGVLDAAGSAAFWAVAAVFAAASACYLGAPRRLFPSRATIRAESRYVVMAISLAVLGLWLGCYATGVDLARVFTGRLPGFESAAAWYLLAGLFVVSNLVLGKVYCSSICPFGTVQEFIYRAVPIHLRVSERADRLARLVRWPLLALWPAAASVAANPSAVAFEPLSAAFVWPARHAPLAAVLLGSVLMCSVFVERFYCKYFCPVGCLADAVSRFKLIDMPGPCGGCYRAGDGCRFLEENSADYSVRKGRLRGDCIS